MRSILLIEDNDELRENTAEILELANYKVTSAENGKVGIQAALEKKPDLIICDVMMPGIDGIQMVKMLRQMPERRNIPILMITAHGDVRANAIEAGANRTIGKPFDLEELITLARDMLSTGSER